MQELLEKPEKEGVLKKAELSCNRILFKLCFNDGHNAPMVKGHTVRNKEFIENVLKEIRSGKKIKNKSAVEVLAESWDELPDHEKKKFRRIKKT